MFFFLGFWLLFLVTSASATSISAEEVPGLYIERERDQSGSLIPSLKMKYSLCVMQKEIAKTEFLNQSDAWFEMRKELGDEYISNISKPPYSEPSWNDSDIGLSREKEYFYGNKYKQIKYGQKFRISERDGLCRLESYAEYEKQYIDDGRSRYKVSLKHKRVGAVLGYESVKIRRSQSPVLIRKEAGMESDAPLKGFSERLVELSQKIEGSGFLNLLTMGARSGVDAVDHLCNEVKSLLTKGSICYWSEMPIYPSIMERPIILKKVQKVFKSGVVEEVMHFELHREFKDSVFEPPSK